MPYIYYIKKYKDNGWNILNTAKTGVNVSSTGSFVKKWTYRECEKLALSCKTRKEFESKSSGAYSVSKKNGWIDKWLPISTNYHKAEYSWTKELCIDIAKKYTSITEFSRQESPTAYLMQNGFLLQQMSANRFLLHQKKLPVQVT